MIKKTFVLITLFGTLTFVSCNKTAEQPQPAPLALQAITVTQAPAQVNLEFPTKIEGLKNIEIRPKANGFIKEIYVDEGQSVKKGQLLFKLETDVLTQDASAAKAAIEAAQVEVDRLTPLVEKGIVGSVLLEAAKARLAQTKATYSGIVANINYANVVAPTDGVIGALPYKPGALVSSTINPPLTTISDTKQVRAYFNLNEKQMIAFAKNVPGASTPEKIKNAPAVQLRLVDNSIFSESGKIAAIEGLIDANTGTTRLRADFNNPDAILRSGSSGTIIFPVSYENVLVIPQKAVLDLQGKNLVYVVDKDGIAQSRTVEILNQTDREYIIASGLEVGDVIVTEGLAKVRDGQPVTVTLSSKNDN
ncbi:efflux RND transporter periplasmic adaptor subunit [Flavobacterium agricola]|uniref:Efflux RND transporter periplasmic adaptor subunit n=1 Tax=Flavobacterium agricola TaxID=2870839 RepID=A0ABY6M1A7_9FLAO|nr:efflux RND transporter periplasmic adaptor subunit [Flavobacterium agricola]UYW02347.1 efflux RND transporter periplasmic adaptor subunit [Flavobacterium agricola]